MEQHNHHNHIIGRVRLKAKRRSSIKSTLPTLPPATMEIIRTETGKSRCRWSRSSSMGPLLSSSGPSIGPLLISSLIFLLLLSSRSYSRSYDDDDGQSNDRSSIDHWRNSIWSANNTILRSDYFNNHRAVFDETDHLTDTPKTKQEKPKKVINLNKISNLLDDEISPVKVGIGGKFPPNNNNNNNSKHEIIIISDYNNNNDNLIEHLQNDLLMKNQQQHHYVKRRSIMYQSTMSFDNKSSQSSVASPSLSSSSASSVSSSLSSLSSSNEPQVLPLVGLLPESSSSSSSSSLLEQFSYVIGWEGMKTILPCNVTMPMKKTSTSTTSTTFTISTMKMNDSIDLILWFRGKDTRALYSIDARKTTTMNSAKHFNNGNELLSTRAFIDLTTRPTSLVIESVKEEDSGEYRCRVDFHRSPSEHRSIKLDVFSPPKELIIMDEFGQRLSDPITPFNEGSHLNLICEAEGGKPRPLLYWYQDDKLIDNDFQITQQGIIRNELFIKRLQRKNQGTILKCQTIYNITDIFLTSSLSSSSSSISIGASTSMATSSSSSTTILHQQDQLIDNNNNNNSNINLTPIELIRKALLSNRLLIDPIFGVDNNNNNDGDNNDGTTTSILSQLFKFKPSYSSILLDLNLRPLTIRITTVQRPLIDGKLIIINCESDGSKPPALISWWKQSERIEKGITEEIIPLQQQQQLSLSSSASIEPYQSTITNRTISTLRFVPKSNDNGKILSCRADHSVLSDSSLEDSWILNVLFAPKLSISFGATIQHDNIHEKSNVSIECHVLANPPIKEIHWMFEGKRLTSPSSTMKISRAKIHENDDPTLNSWIEFNDKTLFIYNVNRQHSGRYRCLAINSQGEGQSEDILLKVQYKPICSRNQRTLFGVAQREPIQVPCSVESDPMEVTFRWMFNSSASSSSSSSLLIPLDSFQVLKPPNTNKRPNPSSLSSSPTTTTTITTPNWLTRTSIINYEPKTRYGYGQLLCWATNKLGEQNDPCRFDIIPADHPQTLNNCNVKNQSLDGLIVRCQPGDDGGLEQKFHLEVFQAEQGQMVANLTTTAAATTAQSRTNLINSNNDEDDEDDDDGSIEFIVKDIPIATTYVLLLYASNAKGRSNYVTLSAATIPPGSRGSEFLKFTADFGIKPMMYLLIMVVSGLILTTIIIMIVSKIRTIKNKSSSSSSNNSRHQSAPPPYSSSSSSSSGSNSNNDNNNNNSNGLIKSKSSMKIPATDNTSQQQQQLGECLEQQANNQGHHHHHLDTFQFDSIVGNNDNNGQNDNNQQQQQQSCDNQHHHLLDLTNSNNNNNNKMNNGSQQHSALIDSYPDLVHGTIIQQQQQQQSSSHNDNGVVVDDNNYGHIINQHQHQHQHLLYKPPLFPPSSLMAETVSTSPSLLIGPGPGGGGISPLHRKVPSSIQQQYHQRNSSHLNLISLKNFDDLRRPQSQSPSSSMDSSHQPPPMYHTVYATNSSNNSDVEPFLISSPRQQQQQQQQIPSITNDDQSNDQGRLLLTMDAVASYHNYPSHHQIRTLERLQQPQQHHHNHNHHQYGTISRDGSMTWSQAETVALDGLIQGTSSSQGGGGDGDGRSGSCLGLLSSPVPLQTLHQQQQQNTTNNNNNNNIINLSISNVDVNLIDINQSSESMV